MATKTYGTHDLTALEERDYIGEMRELIDGAQCPISVNIDRAGNMIGAKYDTTWKEGGSTPVENDDGEVSKYKTEYKSCALTRDQVKKLEAYLSENIKSE